MKTPMPVALVLVSALSLWGCGRGIPATEPQARGASSVRECPSTIPESEPVTVGYPTPEQRKANSRELARLIRDGEIGKGYEMSRQFCVRPTIEPEETTPVETSPPGGVEDTIDLNAPQVGVVVGSGCVRNVDDLLICRTTTSTTISRSPRAARRA